MTGITKRSAAVAAIAALLLASLAGGLVDQQFNGANPRTYDFRGRTGTGGGSDADRGT